MDTLALEWVHWHSVTVSQDSTWEMQFLSGMQTDILEKFPGDREELRIYVHLVASENKP